MKNILLFVALVFVAGTSFADNVVDENFDTGVGTLITTGGPGAAATVSGGSAVFAGADASGRTYLGTSGSDFAASDFTATIDVTITTTGGANGFFGLGPGAEGAPVVAPVGQAGFGEPSLGPTTYLVLNAPDRDGGQINVTDFANVNNPASLAAGTQPVVGAGTHLLVLDYDQATQTVFYSAFINGSALATPLFTIDVSDNPFDATNARIFFGGDDGTTFDNFLVHVPGAVPEPGSTALLGLGVLGSMITNRRRSV